MEAWAEKVWGDVRLEGPSIDGRGACDGDEQRQEPGRRIWEEVGGGGGLGGETNGPLGRLGDGAGWEGARRGTARGI